jgi:hypothetical protein
VSKVLREFRVLKDIKVYKVQPVLVLKEVKDIRVSRELKVFKVLQVPLDQQDLKVLKETLAVLLSTILLKLILQMQILVREILD